MCVCALHGHTSVPLWHVFVIALLFIYLFIRSSCTVSVYSVQSNHYHSLLFSVRQYVYDPMKIYDPPGKPTAWGWIHDYNKENMALVKAGLTHFPDDYTP